MVKKLVRNFITFILSATIFICIQIIIICNSVNTAITRDNFNKCIGTLNKKLLVENNGENFEQIIGGEEIYQIGLESEIRMFGTINGNIFKVYFIDYHHDFEYDERRTTRNKKGNNFCAITSSL